MRNFKENPWVCLPESGFIFNVDRVTHLSSQKIETTDEFDTYIPVINFVDGKSFTPTDPDDVEIILIIFNSLCESPTEKIQQKLADAA